jgi:hypothetical protein
MQPPPLLAGDMNHQNVIGVDVAAVRLVAALREERRRVAERGGVGAIEHRGELVHRRLEDVESFEHAGRAFGEMPLQHAVVDELDLAPLHDLVERRFRRGRPCFPLERSSGSCRRSAGR